jgi:protein TonB
VFQNEANVRRRRVAGHDPAYPAKAERDGVEGVVVAKVVIGPDGRVNDLIFMQTHPVFESTVRDAIAGWKFSPLVVNGQAASVYTVFRFTFKLS